MNTTELGSEIKRLRKNNRLSQKQLAEGICTQPAISGIEAGKVYPSIDILYLLSIRLKVTLDFFIKILLNDSQNYIEVTKTHIDFLLKVKEYQEAYELTSFELKQPTRNLGYYYAHFIKWAYIIAGYYIKKVDFQECVTELLNLLDTSHPLFGHDFQDLKIKNSLAIIYAENEKYQESLDEFNSILNFKDFLNQQPRFHIKIHYNLSKLYFLKHEIEESLAHSSEGITISEKEEDMSMLGHLYFQKGMCLEEKNEDILEIRNCYRKSLLIFQLLGRENYVQMTKDKKGEFL